MATVQCPNGHLFDNSLYPTCPTCSGAAPAGRAVNLNGAPVGGYGRTVGVNNAPGGYNRTVDLNSGASFDHTMMLNTPAGSQTVNEIGKTMPANAAAPANGIAVTQLVDSNRNSEVKPVTAWLVVVEGQKKGTDFRLHAGNNTIGRSKENDVSISFEKEISSVNALSIRYNERNREFGITIHDSLNNVFVNGECLYNTMILKNYDIIEIGSVKFVFVALCGPQFEYNDEKEEKK